MGVVVEDHGAVRQHGRLAQLDGRLGADDDAVADIDEGGDVQSAFRLDPQAAPYDTVMADDHAFGLAEIDQTG